tara:strand:- start:180 stop:473 length:294 start_codon:yes stop_codon:yes gene_type:complete
LRWKLLPQWELVLLLRKKILLLLSVPDECWLLNQRPHMSGKKILLLLSVPDECWLGNQRPHMSELSGLWRRAVRVDKLPGNNPDQLYTLSDRSISKQ